MIMDETLLNVSERVKNFAVIYLVDITNVPDFNKVSSAKLLSLSRSISATLIELVLRYRKNRCTSCTTRAPSCSFTGISTS
jgi:hypothetical protein